ncbi:MAG: hypothetical protein HRU20_22165 [Pseudomonadales bacterium]|nr:hypothetical protein [Pseudomonadales bacterium]
MTKLLSAIAIFVLSLPIAAFELQTVDDLLVEENQVYQGLPIVVTGLDTNSILTFSLASTDEVRTFSDLFGGEEKYPDNSLFTLDPETGEVFLSAKDFENPEDLTPYKRVLKFSWKRGFYYVYRPISERGEDNIYGVMVKATDESGNEVLIGWNVTIEDVHEGDDDGDGVLTRYELAEGTDPYEADFNVTRDFLDTDQDMIPDATEADSDADGISNLDESTNIDPYGDADGDYIPNYLDANNRGDGVAARCSVDSSGKFCRYAPVAGLALDPLFDFSQNGMPNFRSSDSDVDGITDLDETDEDFDLDGIKNYLDRDCDNDFIPDVIERRSCAEINFSHLDSDGDGIPDTIEGSLSHDHDGDGIDDYYDVDKTLGADRNNDGIDDAIIALDSDGDGIANYLDSDSDNDGISDFIESQQLRLDSNNNGIADAYEVIFSSGVDSNGDGIDETSLVNSDGDDLPNYLDLDSDNDGKVDISEVGIHDREEDGLLDANAPTDSLNLPLLNSNGSSLPDYLDVTAEAGQFTIVNQGLQEFDLNNDGQVDVTSDSDLDGIDDTVDTAPHSFGLKPIDSDGDGITDYLDPDDDGDGIADSIEGEGDFDHDGILNRLDLDSDNDGISDTVESALPALIGDSNFNGIDDSIDIFYTQGRDDNADGMDDRFQVADTDADGMPDFIDTDSDNDQIPDRLEYEDKNSDEIHDHLQAESGVYTAGSGAGKTPIFILLALLAVLILPGNRRQAPLTSRPFPK